MRVFLRYPIFLFYSSPQNPKTPKPQNPVKNVVKLLKDYGNEMLKFKATAVVKILFNYYCRARSLKEILTERIQRKKKHKSRSPT